MKFTKVFGLAAALTLMLAFSGCSKTELQDKEGSFVKKDEVKVGDTVQFGNYMGSTDWTVLDVRDGKALLLADKTVDARAYDEDDNDWETSDLREWLNLEYYEQAFDGSEKDSIIMNNGDRVTILTKDEVKEYFSKKEERKTKATEFAHTQGGRTEGASYWWLRTDSGKKREYVVRSNGEIDTMKVSKENIGVRPAIWVDIG